MKIQASITVDSELMLRVKERLRDGSFRNQSHLFEFAVMRFLNEEKLEEKK